MIEALFATTGTLPVNVKFIYEGEEEIGSPHLPAYVEQYKEKLAADLILISDTGLYGPGKPAVCYGLRGLTGIQIDVRGAKEIYTRVFMVVAYKMPFMHWLKF